MNNPIFNTARIYLSNKLQIKNATEMYRYYMQNPIECSEPILKKENTNEILYKLIFLGAYHERRNCGNQVKTMAQACLLQFREQIHDMDVPTLIQLFLVMSNVLLYDQKIIDQILKQLHEKQEQISIKQLQSISHCLYKLGIKNEYWQNSACEAMLSKLHVIGIQDYVQYAHIASNLYHMNQFDEQLIKGLLDILKYKLDKQQKHIFLSKFSYQFIQLLFNLYPEIIKQPYQNAVSDPNNKFAEYYSSLTRDYVICRHILARKVHGLSIDYFENDDFPHLIRVKEDSIQRKQTLFETYVEQMLLASKLNFVQQKRLCVYDVDFVVEDQFVINCNSPLHCIQTLEGVFLSNSPNFLMQQRHIKELGTHKIIDLDNTFWQRFQTPDSQAKEFRRIVNFL